MQHPPQSRRRRSAGLAPLAFLLVLAAGMLPAADGPDGSAVAAQRQAGEAVIAAIRKAGADGLREIVIPPGDYRFPDRGAWSLIHLHGLKHLRIAANGVNFIFEAWKFGLYLTECDGLTIEGLSIDYEPVPYSQGVITAMEAGAEPGSSRLEYRVDAGFLGAGDIDFDPVMKRRAEPMPLIILDRTGTRRKVNQWGRPRSIERTGPDTWRIVSQPPGRAVPGATGPTTYADYGVAVGDRLVLMHRTSDTAILIHKSTAVTCRNVTVSSSPGGAFTEVGHRLWRGGQVFDGCVVERKPGTGRLFSTNADTFHSSLATLGPEVRNCRASNAGDDFVNLRGTLSVVIDAPGGPTVDVCMRADYEADSVLQPGARVALLARNSGARRGEARIVSACKVTDERILGMSKAVAPLLGVHGIGSEAVYRLTLDQELPAGMLDYMLYDDSVGAGFRVEGNRFDDCLAHGVVIQSRDGVIAGNAIAHTAAAGIKLAMYFQWLEGDFCRNIRVSGNRIDDCNYELLPQTAAAMQASAMSSLRQAAILVGTEQRMECPTAVSGRHHSGIDISGNRITSCRAAPICLANTGQVVVQDNQVTFANGAEGGGRIIYTASDDVLEGLSDLRNQVLP